MTLTSFCNNKHHFFFFLRYSLSHLSIYTVFIAVWHKWCSSSFNTPYWSSIFLHTVPFCFPFSIVFTTVLVPSHGNISLFTHLSPHRKAWASSDLSQHADWPFRGKTWRAHKQVPSTHCKTAFFILFAGPAEANEVGTVDTEGTRRQQGWSCRCKGRVSLGTEQHKWNGN